MAQARSWTRRVCQPRAHTARGRQQKRPGSEVGTGGSTDSEVGKALASQLLSSVLTASSLHNHSIVLFFPPPPSLAV